MSNEFLDYTLKTKTNTPLPPDPVLPTGVLPSLDVYALYGHSQKVELAAIPNVKKCECGCSSVGADRHSDYCPLYSKDT